MIKILIIDDDSKKIEKLMSVLNEIPELLEEDIEQSLDINSARRKLFRNSYDLLLLDIQLPNKIGSEVYPDGGKVLLKEIFDVDRLIKPKYIIGVTSSTQTKTENSAYFDEHLWSILDCSSEFEKWKNQIKNKIKYLIKTKEALVSPEYHFDLAIITAVKREYDSIIRLTDSWSEHKFPNDPTSYNVGYFQNERQKIKVVVAMQHQMGMPAAAVLSMKLVSGFRPQYLIMVGIAAGNKSMDIKLGDIVVASESWDYGSGKMREGDSEETGYLFQPNPQQIPIDVKLKEKFSKDYNHQLYQIKNMFEGNKPRDELRLHIGPVASGAAVIQDERIVKEYIDKHNRKLIAVEMETYGVFYAAVNCEEPRPSFFSIKSICDFADAEKNDQFQAYASFTSARFMHYFVTNELF